MKPRAAALSAAAVAVLWTAVAGAHAFPQHEEPGVGAVVREAPTQVSILFDSKVEAAFSAVAVKDGAGKTISGDSHVDSNSQRLSAALPPLEPGRYHVYWKVVAWDGHHTEGDYIFTVRP
jgi:methionine-rich copper-binding protein CopC